MRKVRSRPAAGDLVVVISPFIRVTADGFAKKDPAGLQRLLSHTKDPTTGGWIQDSIPYGSVCLLIDPAVAIVLFEGREHMVQRSCISHLESIEPLKTERSQDEVS